LADAFVFHFSIALLALLSYHLVLSVSLRDRAHFLCALYASLLTLAQTAPFARWPEPVAPFLMALAGWALMVFGRHFLDLALHWPKGDRVLRASQWLLLILAPTAFFLPRAWLAPLTLTEMVVPPALMVLAAASLSPKGPRHARLFLAALSAWLLGSAPGWLKGMGASASDALVERSLEIGALLAFALLSAAMGLRLKLARQDNERLQRAQAAELDARLQTRSRDLDEALRQLAQAQQELQEVTEQDPLTGLKNRLFLAKRLPETWRHALRWQEPLAALMIDVDHFKRVNDAHGHMAGDEALRQIAHLIDQIVQRPGDHAVRYSGEKFLVLLPNTHLAGAAHVAESIRRRIESMPLRFGERSVTLTASAGVACVHATVDVDPQSLVDAADRLLYQAKQNGRNRCALHPEARGITSARPPFKSAVSAGQPVPASSEQT
jgi:diguanylate cyclase (GGDEF)-like protein